MSKLCTANVTPTMDTLFGIRNDHVLPITTTSIVVPMRQFGHAAPAPIDAGAPAAKPATPCTENVEKSICVASAHEPYPLMPRPPQPVTRVLVPPTASPS